MGSIQAVVTDLDGTLLRDDKEICEGDIATARRLKEKGIRLLVATGRHHTLIPRYIRQLGGVNLAICSNGAYLYDFAQGKMLEARFLTGEQAERAKLFAGRHSAACAVYTRDFTCYQRDDPRMSVIAKGLCVGGDDMAVGRDIRSMEDTPDIFTYPIFKIAFTHVNEAKKEELSRTFSDCSLENYPIPSGGFHIEIEPKGCSKGFALRWAAAQLGFSLLDTLAIGDDVNDISLLKEVGCAATPGNAPCRELRSIAKYITVGNNDGVLTDACRHFGVLDAAP